MVHRTDLRKVYVVNFLSFSIASNNINHCIFHISAIGDVSSQLFLLAVLSIYTLGETSDKYFILVCASLADESDFHWEERKGYRWAGEMALKIIKTLSRMEKGEEMEWNGGNGW